ncbi:phosphoesterase family-domain-containing protein [Halteromyces radiatus]|uniref:phosphoesterase family-domain-containing protein n=1 Tax=Halteromyces radiatus TaxID=101107 RepID=UPI00221F593E|nr:phosphoesterase family-domain-containing protein [Halteromyces radiatus]KAI8092571.1 phosphoesterase family-domain-containing protein [Halteromyces radiatus]
MKIISLLLLVLLSILSVFAKDQDKNTTQSFSSGLIPGRFFDRVVIFIFENQDFSKVVKNKYFASLPKKHNGVLLTNYLATTHPSQPNYIALISGSTKGTNQDDKSDINRQNIVDLLEKKKISWKSYQEDYPGHCNTKMDINNYARKHNPFMSFVNISKNKKRCANIVNSKQLDEDIKNNAVPQFVFYTPNLKNDAHDTNIKYASKWFKKYLEKRINNKALNKNTMFAVTFDEDDGGGNNKVYTALFGPDFHRNKHSSTDSQRYNHYSLLRTIEDNWNLGTLKQNDAKAKPIDL